MIVTSFLAFSLLSLVQHVLSDSSSSMPLPFYRELIYTNPIMNGSDVTIAQTLLNRDNSVQPKLVVDGRFGSGCEEVRATIFKNI
jgi:hypothetical protein